MQGRSSKRILFQIVCVCFSLSVAVWSEDGSGANGGGGSGSGAAGNAKGGQGSEGAGAAKGGEGGNAGSAKSGEGAQSAGKAKAASAAQGAQAKGLSAADQVLASDVESAISQARSNGDSERADNLQSALNQLLSISSGVNAATTGVTGALGSLGASAGSGGNASSPRGTDSGSSSGAKGSASSSSSASSASDRSNTSAEGQALSNSQSIGASQGVHTSIGRGISGSAETANSDSFFGEGNTPSELEQESLSDAEKSAQAAGSGGESQTQSHGSIDSSSSNANASDSQADSNSSQSLSVPSISLPSIVRGSHGQVRSGQTSSSGVGLETGQESSTEQVAQGSIIDLSPSPDTSPGLSDSKSFFAGAGGGNQKAGSTAMRTIRSFSGGRRPAISSARESAIAANIRSVMSRQGGLGLNSLAFSSLSPGNSQPLPRSARRVGTRRSMTLNIEDYADRSFAQSGELNKVGAEPRIDKRKLEVSPVMQSKQKNKEIVRFLQRLKQAFPEPAPQKANTKVAKTRRGFVLPNLLGVFATERGKLASTFSKLWDRPSKSVIGVFFVAFGLMVFGYHYRNSVHRFSRKELFQKVVKFCRETRQNLS